MTCNNCRGNCELNNNGGCGCGGRNQNTAPCSGSICGGGYYLGYDDGCGCENDCGCGCDCCCNHEQTCRVLSTCCGPVIYFNDCSNHVLTYKTHHGRAFNQ